MDPENKLILFCFKINNIHGYQRIFGINHFLYFDVEIENDTKYKASDNIREYDDPINIHD